MKVDPKKDYYRILEVGPGAGPRTIRAAYRRLSKTYHPDVSEATQPTRKKQEVNETYSALADPSAKHAYDALRARAASLRVEHAPPPSAAKPPPPTRGASSSPPSATSKQPGPEHRRATTGASARLNWLACSPWPTVGMILFMLLVLLPAIVFIPRDNHWALPLEVCVVWLTAMLSTVTVAVYFGRQGS